MLQTLMTALFFLLLFTSSLLSDIQNTDIDQLSLQAKKEKKHLLLVFHKDGCGFCEKMIYETLDNDTIEALIDQYFILVDIGIDDEGSILLPRDFNEYLCQIVRDGFYPTMDLVDGNNSIVYSVIG